MTDTAVTALKARRRGARAEGRAPLPPTEPAADLGTALTRPHPLVMDPAELPVVIETNGHVVAADLEDIYLRAQVDGIRHYVPDGCRTPVAQQLWTIGQHVRRDVYLTYLTEIGHELPEPYRSRTPQPTQEA